MRDSHLVVLASPELKRLLIFRVTFDLSWKNVVHEHLETEHFPFALNSFDGRHALVLWKNANYRTLVKPSYFSATKRDFPKAGNAQGQDLNSDFNRYPLIPESDPRVAILLGSNQIEILASSNLR